jgi:type-1 restriction enzyme ecoDI specificity protein
MARGKKAAQGLTPEEKLAQALVPVEEQPYQIPENWCWTYIKFLFDVTSSKRVHKEDWTNTGIPFYRTRELVKLSEQGYVDNELFITEDLYDKIIADYGKPTAGDVLISGVGTIGVPYVVENSTPFYFKDGNVIWFQNRKKCNAKYIYYLYKSLFMYNQIHGMSSGTTVDTYTIVNANGTMLPLPPLTEQQRIVDRIESIFAKVDEAKEKAQAVVDGFELRKSAILHKAFTGELTRAWRKENGQDESNWKRVRFDEVAEIKSNLVDPAEYQEYPHIAPDNIEKKTGVLLEYHTIAEDGVKSGKHRFYAGQILYSKIRPYLSKVVIATVDGLCSADMYPINAKGNVKFLWYYMLSDEFLAQASNSGSRSVLPKINQKELSRVMVKTTSIEEQQAIADILDSLIAKENAAKEVAEAVLDQIDTMKKAVLARAFRGELGTNDPTEESAVELLKTML